MENNQNKAPKNVMEEQAENANFFAKVNKNVIIGCVAIFAAVLVGGLIWYFVHASNVKKAQEAMGVADMEMNDSVKAKMYKDIADAGSNAPNQRAKIMTAEKFYADGKYQEALNYLDQVSVSSDIVNVGVNCLKGDCYANLKKLDQALECYNDALDQADGNPQLTPYVLFKQANIYREQKNYEKEYECYSAIRTDYPGFLQDIDKYYERARQAAGK